jgi:LCP family protein required for cell wall assembly
MKDYRLNLIDGIQPIKSLNQGQGKDYMKPNQNAPGHKVGRFFFRASIILLVIVIIFYTNTIFASEGLVGGVGRLSFWEGMARLALGKDKILKGELADRTNILILGIGGADHNGPYLTDTIILLSIKPSTGDVAIFSIPRDLYIPTSDFGWQKINAINNLGITASQNGAALASKTIGNLFNLPIHYWVELDFSAFKDFVNWLGGVDINVDTAFVDNQYPAPNDQFQVVSFSAGQQTMNGSQALVYARSRHGNNNEGSDFARMKRQQKLLVAIKQKMEKDSAITSPTKLWQAYNIFNKRITTNLDFSEMVRFGKIFAHLQQTQTHNYTFEASPNGLLYSEIATNGAYILRPKGGSFKPMADIVQGVFSNLSPKTTDITNNLTALAPTTTAATSTASTSDATPILTKIIILNGTKITGLAQQVKTKLENLNYQIIKIGNAPTQNYIKTIIYTINPIDSGLAELKDTLNADSLLLPDNLKDLATSNTDYLIILGANQ